MFRLLLRAEAIHLAEACEHRLLRPGLLRARVDIQIQKLAHGQAEVVASGCGGGRAGRGRRRRRARAWDDGGGGLLFETARLGCGLRRR